MDMLLRIVPANDARAHLVDAGAVHPDSTGLTLAGA